MKNVSLALVALLTVGVFSLVGCQTTENQVVRKHFETVERVATNVELELRREQATIERQQQEIERQRKEAFELVRERAQKEAERQALLQKDYQVFPREEGLNSYFYDFSWPSDVYPNGRKLPIVFQWHIDEGTVFGVETYHLFKRQDGSFFEPPVRGGQEAFVSVYFRSSKMSGTEFSTPERLFNIPGTAYQIPKIGERWEINRAIATTVAGGTWKAQKFNENFEKEQQRSLARR